MKKIIRSPVTLILTVMTSFLATVTNVLAQGGITNPVVGDFGSADAIDEATSGNLFVRYFVQLWNVAITVGAIIVIVMFIWGAIEWITAGGDTGKVQSAQQRITHAAIGLFLLIASFAIIEFISLIFFNGEFDILNLTLPTAVTGD